MAMFPQPTASEQRIYPTIVELCRKHNQSFKSNKPFECFDGNYIYPDFKLEPSRLVIEIDGSIHWAKSLDRDCKRDFWIEDRGYKVLHIPNEDCGISVEELLRRIKQIYPSFPSVSDEMYNRHKDYRIHKARPSAPSENQGDHAISLKV